MNNIARAKIINIGSSDEVIRILGPLAISPNSFRVQSTGFKLNMLSGSCNFAHATRLYILV
jgi:hypothetical protein